MKKCFLTLSFLFVFLILYGSNSEILSVHFILAGSDPGQTSSACTDPVKQNNTEEIRDTSGSIPPREVQQSNHFFIVPPLIDFSVFRNQDRTFNSFSLVKLIKRGKLLSFLSANHIAVKGRVPVSYEKLSFILPAFHEPLYLIDCSLLN